MTTDATQCPWEEGTISTQSLPLAYDIMWLRALKYIILSSITVNHFQPSQITSWSTFISVYLDSVLPSMFLFLTQPAGKVPY